jgi:hypothetical protein
MMPIASRGWTPVPRLPMPPRRSSRKLLDVPRKPFTFTADSPMAPAPISMDRLVPPHWAVRTPAPTARVAATAPPDMVSAPAPLSSRRLLLGR